MQGDWTVSGYSHVRELGGGSTGRVVLALHEDTDTPVAIKYLRSPQYDKEEFAGRFAKEARLLADIRQPHLVRFLQYVDSPDGRAVVMELVNGATLAGLIASGGPIQPEAALTVFKCSLLALSAVHEGGVLHRDYKPANVLLRGDGSSKLSDVAVAMRMDDQAPAAGTPAYMAPELWEGGAATPATDLYAATTVLHESLIGARPFQAEQLPKLAQAHRSAAIPLKRIPEPLRGLVARGMAKDPGDRPASAAEFAAEVDAVAVAAYGDDWQERGQKLLAQRAGLLAIRPSAVPRPAERHEPAPEAEPIRHPEAALAMTEPFQQVWDNGKPLKRSAPAEPQTRADLMVPVVTPARADTPTAVSANAANAKTGNTKAPNAKAPNTKAPNAKTSNPKTSNAKSATTQNGSSAGAAKNRGGAAPTAPGPAPAGAPSVATAFVDTALHGTAPLGAAPPRTAPPATGAPETAAPPQNGRRTAQVPAVPAAAIPDEQALQAEHMQRVAQAEAVRSIFHPPEAAPAASSNAPQRQGGDDTSAPAFGLFEQSSYDGPADGPYHPQEPGERRSKGRGGLIAVAAGVATLLLIGGGVVAFGAAKGTDRAKTRSVAAPSSPAEPSGPSFPNPGAPSAGQQPPGQTRASATGLPKASGTQDPAAPDGTSSPAAPGQPGTGHPPGKPTQPQAPGPRPATRVSDVHIDSWTRSGDVGTVQFTVTTTGQGPVNVGIDYASAGQPAGSDPSRESGSRSYTLVSSHTFSTPCEAWTVTVTAKPGGVTQTATIAAADCPPPSTGTGTP
ncbi:MAG TPA: protein kinase [Actinomadura sp.]|nr:protein kinase [Actinomadura sp.]